MVKKGFIDLNDVFPEVEFNDKFVADYSRRVKNKDWKRKIRVQLKKIICNPLSGKPMRSVRKGTREVYLDSYRLAYLYSRDEDILKFLRIYHKDNQ